MVFYAHTKLEIMLQFCIFLLMEELYTPAEL
jgi:hypothetical protein